MKIIVCDDTAEERLALCSNIKKYLEEINCTADIIIFEDGESLLKNIPALEANDVHILFLDIYMPGLTGIEVAKKLRESGAEIVIIFTTTSPDHGLDGFSVKAFQYLLKPISYPILKETLDDCMAIFADALRCIEVTADKVVVKIPLKDIIYIEIIAHYGLIHTNSGTIRSRITLDEMEKQLEESTFLRTHRSFIVNMRYIKKVADDDFLLTTGGSVPIRRTDKVKIKKEYMDYVFTRTRGE